MQDKQLKDQIDCLWRVRVLNEVSESDLRTLESQTKYREFKALFIGHGGNSEEFDNQWGLYLDRLSGAPMGFINPTE